MNRRDFLRTAATAAIGLVGVALLKPKLPVIVTDEWLSQNCLAPEDLGEVLWRDMTMREWHIVLDEDRAIRLARLAQDHQDQLDALARRRDEWIQQQIEMAESRVKMVDEFWAKGYAA